MKNYFYRGAAMLFLSVSISSPVLATNGYFAHGYGTKNKGMAGGGSAYAQDAMIAATNPAAMVTVGNRMDIGGAIFSPSPRSYDATGASGLVDGAGCGGPCPFEIGPQSIESDNDYFIIPHFARNWMLDTMSSIGLTVYGNGGMNTEYKGGTALHDDGTGTASVTPGTFGAGTAGVDLSQLFITTTYSRKLSDTASYGASLIVAYQRFEAKGLELFRPFSSDPDNLTNNGYDASTGFGVKLGIQGEVSPGIILAASYQSEVAMGEFDDYAGLFAEDGGFDIPATITLGLAWKISPQRVFVVDVQTIYYSDIASVGNSIDPLLTNCSPGLPTVGGTGDGCLGADGGAGFGWDDMTIFKLGYVWSTDDHWTWRVGYSQGDQPIPSDEVMFNILAPAVIEQHLTFGFTKQLDQQSEFNFAFMYALEDSVKGGNPLNPFQEIELEMSQFEFEGSYSKKF